MYIEQQLAELTHIIQAGFENLADILRSQAATVQPSAPQPAETENPSITGLPNGQDQTSQLTFDHVNALAQEAARQKSPPVIIDLIRQHGASRLAEMDPKHYPAFVAALEVLLRKGEAAL